MHAHIALCIYFFKLEDATWMYLIRALICSKHSHDMQCNVAQIYISCCLCPLRACLVHAVIELHVLQINDVDSARINRSYVNNM